MLSKITHLFKYGIIGALAGGALKILINYESPNISVMPLLIWVGSGAGVAMLFSLIVERYFNETYHD